MSNAEAIKLINNIKFEEGPTISTALGPYTTHFWAREIAVFLTRISAVHLVVHNDERAQSDTWFGYVDIRFLHIGVGSLPGHRIGCDRDD
jgi:hypothetical protein